MKQPVKTGKAVNSKDFTKREISKTINFVSLLSHNDYRTKFCLKGTNSASKCFQNVLPNVIFLSFDPSTSAHLIKKSLIDGVEDRRRDVVVSERWECQAEDAIDRLGHKSTSNRCNLSKGLVLDAQRCSRHLKKSCFSDRASITADVSGSGVWDSKHYSFPTSTIFLSLVFKEEIP